MGFADGAAVRKGMTIVPAPFRPRSLASPGIICPCGLPRFFKVRFG